MREDIEGLTAARQVPVEIPRILPPPCPLPPAAWTKPLELGGAICGGFETSMASTTVGWMSSSCRAERKRFNVYGNVKDTTFFQQYLRTH
jgi:hypothetical protein